MLAGGTKWKPDCGRRSTVCDFRKILQPRNWGLLIVSRTENYRFGDEADVVGERQIR